jgi:hypothetical protein
LRRVHAGPHVIQANVHSLVDRSILIDRRTHVRAPARGSKLGTTITTIAPCTHVLDRPCDPERLGLVGEWLGWFCKPDAGT